MFEFDFNEINWMDELCCFIDCSPCLSDLAIFVKLAISNAIRDIEIEFNFDQGVCSNGGVVATALDFESGHPGSNPEWGLIYYCFDHCTGLTRAFIPSG